MNGFIVDLIGKATVKTTVYVNAETEEDAIKEAIESAETYRDDGRLWNISQCDGLPVVTDVGYWSIENSEINQDND